MHAIMRVIGVAGFPMSRISLSLSVCIFFCWIGSVPAGAQVAQKTSAAASPSLAQQGIILTEKGDCKQAVPVLKER